MGIRSRVLIVNVVRLVVGHLAATAGLLVELRMGLRLTSILLVAVYLKSDSSR